MDQRVVWSRVSTNARETVNPVLREWGPLVAALTSALVSHNVHTVVTQQRGGRSARDARGGIIERALCLVTCQQYSAQCCLVLT